MRGRETRADLPRCEPESSGRGTAAVAAWRCLLVVTLGLLAAGCGREWPWSAAPVPAPGSERVRVVFVTDGPAETLPAEEAAALEWLRAQPDFAVETLQIVDLAAARLPVPGVLWWHRARSEGLPSASVREPTMAAVHDFLERGGGVLLTLLAAPWVVPLGLDSEPPDSVGERWLGDDLVPMGLQSNWGHPLLRRFWGGVLTFTPAPGRSYPMALYTGERWPRHGRVWAVARRQPRVDPTLKVGVEYPPTAARPGGHLLTLGAYCYFDSDDGRRLEHLRLLVADALRYVAGRTIPPPAGAAVPAAGAPRLPAGPSAPGRSPPPPTQPPAAADLPLPSVLSERRWWQPEPRHGVRWFEQSAAAGPPPQPAFDAKVLDELAAVESGLAARRQAPADAPLTLAAPRTLAVTSQRGRVEGLWAHPVRLLRDLRFGIVSPGEGITWLDSAPGERLLTVRPEGHTLQFRDDELEVTLDLAVGRRRPALVALLSVRAPAPVQVVAAWQADHETGWPEQPPLLGPLYLGWDAGAHAAVWRDRFASLTVMAGFGLPPRVRVPGFQPDHHVGPDGLVQPATDPAVDAPLPTPRVAIQVPFDPAGAAVLPFVVVGGLEEARLVRRAYAELLADPASLRADNAAYWRGFLGDTLEVTSPDPELDAAFRWAKAGLEALRVTTPGQGTGAAAAYLDASAPPAGRRQAALRGSAAAWAAMAASAIGDDELAADTLRVLGRYRDVDGSIPGMLSPAWELDFDEPDATPLFLIALDRVVRRSNDLELARQLWPAARAALAARLASDADADGLPEGLHAGTATADVGLPGAEGSTLYLTALWAEALRSAARLATQLQDVELARSTRQLADAARAALNGPFWDPAGRFYFHSRRLDGSFVAARSVLPAVPLLFGLLDSGNVTPVLEALAASELTTDWGARRRQPPATPVAADANGPSPSGGNGSPPDRGTAEPVEPRYTGWAALAEYAHHRPVAAFQHSAALLRLVGLEAPGQLPHAYRADLLGRHGPVLHDAASHALALLPVVEGMLGLRVDAAAPSIELVPQLPAHWERLAVGPIRAGDDVFRVTLQRSAERLEFHIERLQGERPVTLRLGDRVPADIDVDVDRERSTGLALADGLETVSGLYDKAALISGRMSADRAVVVFRHRAHPRLVPPLVELTPGALSSGLRVIAATYRADTLSLTVEGLPGHTYTLRLASRRRITGVTGVPSLSVSAPEAGWPWIDFAIPGTGSRYSRVVLVMTFAP